MMDTWFYMAFGDIPLPHANIRTDSKGRKEVLVNLSWWFNQSLQSPRIVASIRNRAKTCKCPHTVYLIHSHTVHTHLRVRVRAQNWRRKDYVVWWKYEYILWLGLLVFGVCQACDDLVISSGTKSVIQPSTLMKIVVSLSSQGLQYIITT